MVSVSIGESIQAEVEYLQYLGRSKNIAFITSFRTDNQEINSYQDFKPDGSYKQNYNKWYLNFQNSGSDKIAIGVGTAFEYVHYNPAIHSVTEVKGRFTSLKSYVYLKFNSLNQIFYPRKGIKINTELGQVYDQNPNLTVYKNGVPEVPSNLNFDNFSRFVFDGSLFTSFNSKFTFFSELQAGVNFTSSPNKLNNYLIGGINGSFRNQIRFAGLQEATVNSSSVVSLQVGLRYNLANNIYIIGRSNALLKDFVTRNNSTSGTTALTGYALTFAYKTPIGPLELSAMYCDQSKKLQSYVLIGIPF